VAVSIQPSCDVPTGTISFSSPVGADILYSINGINYQPSGSFALLPPGQYSASVRDISTGCVTTPSPLTVKAVDPATCGNRDIYFPSVFTPNADGKNDGFGPGPISNLAGISAYTLSVYNRYGQLIFTTHDPLKRWDGMYKGYLLANYSYVWQASYKKANGTERLQKGTVLIIK
jgi:gliding motility-associated-like protein